MSPALVVMPAEDLAALIEAAVERALREVGERQSAQPAECLLTTAEVRDRYRIGRYQLLAYGNQGRLPFVTRKVRGGKTARFYRPDDCKRVLADTLRKF